MNHETKDQALCNATWYEDIETVKVLLATGANVHAQNDAAISNAAMNGNLELAEVLMAAGADATAGLQSSTDFELVKYFVELGANIHDDEEKLSDAARCGKLDIVEYLIGCGANVNANDGYALSYAACEGYPKIVKILLAAGANARAQDSSALREAAKGNDVEMVGALLTAGADISVAFEYGSPKVLKYLTDSTHKATEVAA